MTDTAGLTCRGCERAALHPGAACTKHGTPAPAVALPIERPDEPDTEMTRLVEWLREQTWSEFAQSLAQFHADRGFLSDRQVAAAVSMRAKVAARERSRTAAVAAGHMPAVEIPKGVHRNAEGEIVKVYATQRGALASKLLVEHVLPDGSEWEFVYHGRTYLKGLNADTLLPMEDARKFGRLTGRCINCMTPISDERSLAAGYGPKCARNHGWWYPNMVEATEIIAREGLELIR